MKPTASVIFDERRWPWQIAIEPWALAIDIPARQTVKIVVFGEPAGEHPVIEIGHDGQTVAFDHEVFDVHIGETVEHFNFTPDD